MSVSLRKRRSVAVRPQTNRPQTITGQQNKVLSAQELEERQTRETEARQRRARRRLDELERVNHRDVPISLDDSDAFLPSSSSVKGSGIGASSAPPVDREGDGAGAVASATASGSTSAKKKRTAAEIKRLLATKTTFNTLLQDSIDQGRFHTKPNYLSAASNPSASVTAEVGRVSTPQRHFCSICGYHGDMSCIRCGHRYCSAACADTHNETRCLRPIR